MKKILIIMFVLTLIFLNACSTSKPNGEDNMKIVVLETNKGNIEIELNETAAPITVKNFLSYVQESYYDGTVFHRVIPSFMIQGGGFTADNKQKETKDPIIIESNNGLKNDVGTIAMARTNDPNSATSQFFINTVDNNFLNYAPGNPGYAVFGKVISGLDVVKSIESVPTTTKTAVVTGGIQAPMETWPVENVIINKAYVK